MLMVMLLVVTANITYASESGGIFEKGESYITYVDFTKNKSFKLRGFP